MSSKFRKWFDKYERAFMIGLVIFVLVIFTVTSDIENWFRAKLSDEYDPSKVVGSFAVLKGDKTEVTAGEYNSAVGKLMVWNFLISGQDERPDPSEVWTHMLLLEAAKREGVGVSNEELTRFLRQAMTPRVFDDRPLYKQMIRERFRIAPIVFEEGIRDVLVGMRLRELHFTSYRLAPPATRESMVKQYAASAIEPARVTWARLPASKFLKAATDELKTEDNPDSKLKAFFEKDAAVKSERTLFRHPTRYTVELLITPHKKVSKESLARFKAMFAKTFPDVEMKSEPTVEKMKEYFALYTDRILEQAGTTIEQISHESDDTAKKDGDDPEKDEATPAKEGDKPEKDEEKPVKEGDEPKEPGDPQEGDEPKEPEEPEKPEKPELTAAQKQVRYERAFALVREQIQYELEVRWMFWYLRNQAAKDSRKSLSELFEQLRKNDDPKNPVCSTESGKGILQLRTFVETVEDKDGKKTTKVRSLTGEEIENLESYDDKLTHNGRHRVTSLAGKDLPYVSDKPETAGMAAHMRMIVRLIAVESERRKTFDELDEDEKDELRDQFFIPSNARDRAKAALEALRKKCEAGTILAADFKQACESLGCSVIEGEWIQGGGGFAREPSDKSYWRSEYEHMRDRHFLRRSLPSVLGADRAGTKYKAGSYLPIQMDSNRDDEDDPGAAYLILLLERRKPDANTMPLHEFETFVTISRRQRSAKEAERWTRDWPSLIKHFGFEFRDEMQDQVENELEQRRTAERKRRGRP